MGGDEFAVLLEELGEKEEGIAVVERIQEELPQSVTIAGQEIFTSASIGVVFHSDHYQEAEELIRDADTAMYAAKSKGRGRLPALRSGVARARRQSAQPRD